MIDKIGICNQLTDIPTSYAVDLVQGTGLDLVTQDVSSFLAFLISLGFQVPYAYLDGSIEFVQSIMSNQHLHYFSINLITSLAPKASRAV